MKAVRKTTPSQDGQTQLEALRQAVNHTLEKKRRLGQYAVIWRDGKPVTTEEDTKQPEKC